MAAAPVVLVNVARQIQNVFERSPLVWCSLPRACFVMPVSLAILVRLIFAPILFFMPKCIFFLQLYKVGLSKTFHLILILFSCHDDTPQFYHLNCSFTMVTSVPSLHLLLTLTIDLIAKVHDYYLKIYYRYYICYYSGIPGIWGCFK